MKTILLSIDRNESRARIQANTVVDLFDTDNIEVELFHVFESNPEGASVQQLGSIRRAREILNEAGIETVINSDSGDPADNVLRRADEIDARAICIAARKRSPTGKFVFGSVTQDVILKTDRSVLICDSDEEL
jgi:nucleotide-binding universal stress UspA family protein